MFFNAFRFPIRCEKHGISVFMSSQDDSYICHVLRSITSPQLSSRRSSFSSQLRSSDPQIPLKFQRQTADFQSAQIKLTLLRIHVVLYGLYVILKGVNAVGILVFYLKVVLSDKMLSRGIGWSMLGGFYQNTLKIYGNHYTTFPDIIDPSAENLISPCEEQYFVNQQNASTKP